MKKTVKQGALTLLTLWYLGLVLAAVVVAFGLLAGHMAPAPTPPAPIVEAYDRP